MSPRPLLVALAALLAAPMGSLAADEARIAALTFGQRTPERAAYYEAFRDELRALGWVEGRNLVLDFGSLWGGLGDLIGIGGHLAVPPLPHHRAYGSRTWRFDWGKLGQEHEHQLFRQSRALGCWLRHDGFGPWVTGDPGFALVCRRQGQ